MGKKSQREEELVPLVRSWARALKAGTAGKKKAPASPYTVRNYLKSVHKLASWLDERELPTTVTAVEGDDVTDWLQEIAEATSNHNALHHYRNVKSFWSWVVREKLLSAGEDPMLEVEKPHPEDVRRPPLSQEEVSALLRTCERTGFRETRDAAIIRTLADTGMRVGGLLGLRWSSEHPGLDNKGRNDVFLDHDPPLIRLRLKGGAVHFVDIAPRTATAIDRYLRNRAKHRLADDPALWLGYRGGGFTRGGVQGMLNRRAERVGIAESVHPHRFRRSMATWHIGAGGSPDSLMARAGWVNDQMIRLYISDSRDRLAWQESQRLGIANHL
ncbi:tyrosine-type recombinase/integrase [Nocardiopsis salina]|uniref:tyrosine-type recombinase/integrase n=1 Tax=Nocardiopsis salina TaxID=245836 RepID=UPI000348A5D5|nr:tyrosine-type recombinase/integrase [Nocardiopsis salina]